MTLGELVDSDIEDFPGQIDDRGPGRGNNDGMYEAEVADTLKENASDED